MEYPDADCSQESMESLSLDRIGIDSLEISRAFAEPRQIREDYPEMRAAVNVLFFIGSPYDD